ncbi:MAG TPA: prepilin-type N-terminal cleavage/methylation domain-containing protein [Kiritimatiellia bacterium]|nr:prepilin-type N-terminal cleavage/methylation domain-containing protein [Kiritimatiellia bacterium]
MRTQHGKGAFTLVELLAVVAIIAVLAALLMPALANSRSAALASRCKSNLRQVAAGLFSFAGDHDGRNVVMVKTASGSDRYWPLFLTGTANITDGGVPDWIKNNKTAYIPASDVFACPSNPKKYEIASGVSGYGYGMYSTAQGINFDDTDGALNDFAFREVYGGTRPYAEFHIPGRLMSMAAITPWIMDSFCYKLGSDALFGNNAPTINPTLPTHAFGYPYVPHDGGINVMFYDGHVAQQTPADVRDSPIPYQTFVDARGELFVLP